MEALKITLIIASCWVIITALWEIVVIALSHEKGHKACFGGIVVHAFIFVFAVAGLIVALSF